MGLLSKSKKEPEKKEWYDGRAFFKFDRLTEVLHFLDGQTRDITYDKDVINYRRSSIEDNSIWIVNKEQSFRRQNIPTDYGPKFNMTKVGIVHRDGIPYINTVLTEKKVFVIDNIKTNGDRFKILDDSKWYWADDEFERQENDVLGHMRKK